MEFEKLRKLTLDSIKKKKINNVFMLNVFDVLSVPRASIYKRVVIEIQNLCVWILRNICIVSFKLYLNTALIIVVARNAFKDRASTARLFNIEFRLPPSKLSSPFCGNLTRNIVSVLLNCSIIFVYISREANAETTFIICP